MWKIPGRAGKSPLPGMIPAGLGSKNVFSSFPINSCRQYSSMLEVFFRPESTLLFRPDFRQPGMLPGLFGMLE
jgi:hypothetical protein